MSAIRDRRGDDARPGHALRAPGPSPRVADDGRGLCTLGLVAGGRPPPPRAGLFVRDARAVPLDDIEPRDRPTGRRPLM